MRLGEFVVPVVGAMAVALIATTIHRRVAPPVAARLLAVTISIVVVAGVALGVAWAASFALHLPSVPDLVAWCRHVLGSHDSVPGWTGVGASLLLAAGAVRAYRVLRAWWSFRRTELRPVEVVHSDDVFAFTLPGPAGRIVVSTGLLRSLGPDEVDVVLAHERAHARLRHDRYVLLGDVAVAIMPWLRPLQRRLDFALERWADESAVASVNGDRGLVARTLAFVALSHVAVPPAARGFTGLGVAARVDALLRPSTVAPRPISLAVMGVGAALVFAGGALQLHHVGSLLLELCWS